MRVKTQRLMMAAGTLAASVLLAVPSTALAATGGGASPPAHTVVAAAAPAASAAQAADQASTPAPATVYVAPNGTRVLRSPSGNLIAEVPRDAANSDGFTCISFYDCGYEFSTFQTEVIIDAAAAGGVAAATAACSSLGVSAPACAIIGAVAGSVLISVVNHYLPGKCLYASLTVPGEFMLLNC